MPNAADLYENSMRFYIDGEWVTPEEKLFADVVNPATERVITQVALGGAADVDRAVAAAKAAFPTWAQTSREDRLEVLTKVAEVYARRSGDLVKAVTEEMGSPVGLSSEYQVPLGLGHLHEAIALLREYPFEELRGTTMIRREPVGVCALITPWNWPLNQILCKVAPALAAGCTMVWKPSEITPLDAILLAEIMDEAGVPRGVFNLVNGEGQGVGSVLTGHADVDMVSFTGSTRAGIQVSKNAAETVKRVTLELGGKSANIVLSDANLAEVAGQALQGCFLNSGQTCVATTRLLVPIEKAEELERLLEDAVSSFTVGDPQSEKTVLGPLAGKAQFDKVQGLIQAGIDEGARLLVGGLGRPEGMSHGYYVRPTVFVDVEPGMRIEREEIFGPVLAVLTYSDEDEALRIANDSPYGLSGAVQSTDPARAREVASRMRTGMVSVNGAQLDLAAPFGGYKQSGNGREFGEFGLHEFVEVKAIMGYQAA